MESRLIVVAFLITILSSCASSSTGLVTSNIPFGNKEYEVIKSVKKIKLWYSIDFGISGFPLTNTPINLSDIIIKENNADALVNIKYWNNHITILPFVINRYGIEADVVKFKQVLTEEEKRKLEKEKRVR